MPDIKSWPDCWKGQTVVCLASGPSLTAEDIEIVRRVDLRTIVTNTTFRDAPWADALMGMDAAFWNYYGPEVETVFAGARFTTVHYPRKGVETLYLKPWFRHFGNSGADAISLAISAGASRIIALGIDCCPSPAGKLHHHENHPKPMSNCRSIKTWPAKFGQLAKYAKTKEVLVINSSRNTALTCFACATLLEVLAAERV